MSGWRTRRADEQPSPGSPGAASGGQEEVGGDLERVLAALETLTGKVVEVSQRQEEQHARLEELRRGRAAAAEEAAARGSECAAELFFVGSDGGCR